MSTLAFLLCQAAFWTPAGGEERLPRIGDVEWQERERGASRDRDTLDFMGIEAFVLWTRFDDGLFIEEHAGIGAEFQVGWDHGVTTQVISLGYAGWNTENEDSLTPSGVKVRQYRLGYGVQFSTRILEFGLGANIGVYRFARKNENDTSPFLELEGSLGVRPAPMFKVGLMGLATHTQSSFNRSHTHLFHNYSIGPVVEIRF